MIAKLILAFVALIISTIFIINNSYNMSVKFLKWEAKFPFILIILGSILVGLILSLPAYIQFTKKIRKKEKYLTDRVAQLEEELGKKKDHAKK